MDGAKLSHRRLLHEGQGLHVRAIFNLVVPLAHEATDMRVEDTHGSYRQVLGANPLIIADSPALLVYLDRYVRERERGNTLKDAHDLAMKTAGITIVNKPA